MIEGNWNDKYLRLGKVIGNIGKLLDG